MGLRVVRRIALRAGTFAGFPLLTLLSAPVAVAAEGGGVTVIPDWSFLLQMANFVFLIIVLNLLLYRPIRRILRERRETFEGLEAAARRAAASREEQEAAWARTLKDARAKGLKIKEEMVREAELEEKRLTGEIHARAQAELEEVRERIRREAAEARAALERQVEEYADHIVRKLLGRPVA
ncbi:MAG: ATPase [Desulfobacterales bacterium]